MSLVASSDVVIFFCCYCCCCCVSSSFSSFCSTDECRRWMSITDKVKYVLHATVKCVKLWDKRERNKKSRNRLIYSNAQNFNNNNNKTTCTMCVCDRFAIANSQHFCQWHVVVVQRLFTPQFLFILFMFNAFDCLHQIIVRMHFARHTNHFHIHCIALC